MNERMQNKINYIKHINKLQNIAPSGPSPVIVCIAKLESNYIVEFVNYHLKLGFNYIFLYDNEDKPTYESILENYKDNVIVTHLPGKNYEGGAQYESLRHFVTNYMKLSIITHVIHIDIDEFIVLKKHKNIKDFVSEYIKTPDNNIRCGGIGINWRFFGSNGHSNNWNIPNTIRFTMCERKINPHIKTLFNKEVFKKYLDCHSIEVNNKNYPIKSTNGDVVIGPVNNSPTNDVIQLNHYKCKTLPEFKFIRKRLRADLKNDEEHGVKYKESYRYIEETFRNYDLNETEDLTAYTFYNSIK